MPILTRDMLPPDPWEYNYQIGFVLWDQPVTVGEPPSPLGPTYDRDWSNPIIFWRTVPKKKFLRRYFESGFVSSASHPDDVLAIFHAGDVQRFGRRVFRAKK